MQQVLVKRCRRLIVLQIDDWLAFDLYDVSDLSHLEFRVDRRGEARGENDSCFGEALESFGRDCNFVSPWWK